MNGLIRRMAHNGVAANLLLLVMLVAGIVAAFGLEQEVFPELDLPIVEVRVPYPGGAPTEVENGIVRRIEERMEGIEGVREVTATAAQSVGLVRVELELGEDVNRRLDEIKAEVDRITSFPEQADEPIVTLLSNRRRVMELVLHGPTDPTDLKRLAYRVEDEISNLEGVSFVQIAGVAPYEVSIEVPRHTLRALGLTLTDVATAIDRSSIDLPAGEIETAEDEILVRVESQRYTAAQFADAIVVATPSGDELRLGEIATIRDGLADDPIATRFNGDPAILVQIFRTGDEQVLKIADAVDTYVADELSPSLPTGIEATIWQNDAQRLRDRFALLLQNGALGLVLVVVTLALFLEIRLALWVAAGILVSFVGAFAVMSLLDVSINMLTLFGFILAIRIVVDDAIVVGENVFDAKQEGGGLSAAVRGAQRVARPVIFAVATTMLAFVGLLFIPGATGRFLGQIPIVVLAVLGLSLVESLVVLPHHLGTLSGRPPGRLRRALGSVQSAVDRGLRRFVDGPLQWTLWGATKHPGTVLAIAVSLLVVGAGLVGAGHVRFVFLPDIEADYVLARVEMPPGTPAARTRAVAEDIAADAERAIEALQAERSPEGPPLVINRALAVGLPLIASGPPEAQTGIADATTADVVLQLSSPDQRDVPAADVAARWREAVGEMPEVSSLVFSSSLIDFGASVQVELRSDTEADLVDAVQRLEHQLRGIEGVYDVRDDRDAGKRELRIELTPRGRALGVTEASLAARLRAAFFGIEAERMQRGPEEVRVYVRLPADERHSIADLHALRIRTRDGASLPLREVAELHPARGPTTINRRNGRRIVTVRADVDASVVTGGEVSESLRSEVLPGLVRELPSVRWELGGEQREQRESLPAISRNFVLAVLAMYATLAIAFVSYGQPLVILASIPFGFLGALFGHVIMGIDISMLSLFGIVGMAGVVVNDSLVMMDFVNERIEQGVPRRKAVVTGAMARFRPIMLTSLTTFLGVFPLVVEQSIQAQFLIPLAVSIGFGVLLGTAILMLVVSALAELHLRWTEQ